METVKTRILREAWHIIHTGATVRMTARRYAVSKSTVHHDMVVVLPKIDPHMAEAVRKVFDKHKELRARRGGAATKKKWEAMAELDAMFLCPIPRK